MPRADEETLQRVRVVLAEAMERGHDAAEALDRAGLLHFSDRVHEVRRLTLLGAAETFDVMNVKQVAAMVQERMPTSTLDGKRHLVLLLRKMAQP